MNKTKVGPQDLTLLDEFERNAEIVLEILESSLQTIAKWQEDLRKRDPRFIAQRTRNDVIGILESFHPFADAFPQILRFLTFHIPDYKGRVEGGYAHINDKIMEIVHKYGQDPLSVLSDQATSWAGDIYVEMCELRHHIENLSEDLHYCVRIAREQQAQKKDIQRDTSKPEKARGSWCGRIYEITLKVLVDAFLERFWPKLK